MSVARRPFDDPRNTYIVDNNDPSAFDKSYKGRPGTHSEQRCCGDRAPFWDYENAMRVSYSQRPITPQDYGKPGVILWCHECETELERAWSRDYLPALESAIPVVRGVAMALSYIPVWGTAISFTINASLNLAQGQDISEAAIDAIGESLPGQPASGMAFSTVRAVANGDRLDEIALQALPIDTTAKDAIRSGMIVVTQLVNGQRVDDALMGQLYSHLPPEGRTAVDITRRLLAGENISDEVIKGVTGQAADIVRAQVDFQLKHFAGVAAAYGESEVAPLRNQFLLQAGYYGGLSAVAPYLRDSVSAGLMGGFAEVAATNPPFLFGSGPKAVESAEAKAANDISAAKGKKLMATDFGITWLPNGKAPPVLVSSVRNGKEFAIVVDSVDTLTLQPTRELLHSAIDEDWRRGFDVAIGACEGLSVDGPGQKKIAASLPSASANAGFRAGQALQFERTTQKKYADMTATSTTIGQRNIQKAVLATKETPNYAAMAAAPTRQNMASPLSIIQQAATSMANNAKPVGLGKIVTAQQRAALEKYAMTGAAVAASNPQIGAGRGLSNTGEYRWGFDIGTAVSQGQTDTGPGKEAIRNQISPFSIGGGPVLGTAGSNEAIRGFDVGMAIQFGLTKARASNASVSPDAATAAGQLAIQGMSGSTLTSDQKAAAAEALTAHPSTKAGAKQAVEEQKGFFTKLAEFFGLA